MIELCFWFVVAAGLLKLADAAGALGRIETWRWMSSLSRGIVIVLAVMLLRTLAATGDRVIRFGRARRQSGSFVRKSRTTLSPTPDQILALAEGHRQSHVATVVRAGLSGFFQSPLWSSPDERIDACRRSMSRTSAATRAELKYGLANLATIASTAPFIGLLGTVFGLLNAFRQREGQVDAVRAALVEGLSEALLTTALGLAVALLAACSYNFFRDRLTVLETEMGNAASELIGHLWLRHRQWQLQPLCDIYPDATLLNPAVDRNGKQPWEVVCDSQAFFLPLWLFSLYFASQLAWAWIVG